MPQFGLGGYRVALTIKELLRAHKAICKCTQACEKTFVHDIEKRPLQFIVSNCIGRPEAAGVWPVSKPQSRGVAGSKPNRPPSQARGETFWTVYKAKGETFWNAFKGRRRNRPARVESCKLHDKISRN